MHRSKRILIVCHCILNNNAKIFPLAVLPGVSESPVLSHIHNGTGIFQLPCPELSYLGVNRWGMTREQYEHPNFVRHCRDLLTYPLQQIEAFRQAGYYFSGVMGVDGSPNCGMNLTCTGFSGGEICSENSVAQQIRHLQTIPGRGVFMSVFLDALEQIGLQPPLLAVKEEKPPE